MSEPKSEPKLRPRLFISYSRKDKGYVDDLSSRLREAGAEVFQDDAIETGGEFPKRIKHELAASDFLVLIVSPNMLESKWVSKEIHEFWQGPGTRRILPVVIEDVDKRHPNYPIQLAEINELDARGKKDPLPGIMRGTFGWRAEIHVHPSRLQTATAIGGGLLAASVALILIALVACGQLDGRDGRDGRDSAQADTTPAGTIVAFSGGEIPSGWLPCDGSIIDPEAEDKKYVRLVKAIHDPSKVGESFWGSGGDGSGPLVNIPDLRGMFLRGAHGNKNQTDPGPRVPDNFAVGSSQKDAVGPHKHPALCLKAGKSFIEGGSLLVPRMAGGTDTTEVCPWPSDPEGSETRPRNAAVNFIIKY